jgi:hypothetical protein
MPVTKKERADEQAREGRHLARACRDLAAKLVSNADVLEQMGTEERLSSEFSPILPTISLNDIADVLTFSRRLLDARYMFTKEH